MIHSITVINDVGDSITLELYHPEKSGLIVEEIEGLGPPNADVNFTELASLDGSLDNSARVGVRNIVLHLLFLEHPTIEDTRLLVYKHFPIKKMLTLAIETDNRYGMIQGRVESNTPDIFSEQEGCQISILCPEPYFQSLSTYSSDFSGMESVFEFAFENDPVNEPTLRFGEISDVLEKAITYTGDADVGVQLTVHAIGRAYGVVLHKMETRESMRINDEKLAALTGAGFGAGDDILIDTTRGKRTVQLLRGGRYFNILNCIDRNADWFQLQHGTNTFSYMAEYGYENIKVLIENRILYEGV